VIRVSSYLGERKIPRFNRAVLLPIPTAINGAVKRAFDVVTSLIGLILLAPFFTFIAFLIRRDTPGPVFYWGPRAGRNGRPFKILKFRTMYERRESYSGPQVTCKGDRRITPIGRWLRDTKINELPQLWNVLVGEMSLVGPRPEDPDIASKWPADVRKEILSVRPGVTSPASILYRDEESRLSASNLMSDYLQGILPDKMRLDRLYVRNHTLLIDLDAIFWTMIVLIPRMVKSRIPEGYLFAGPLSRLFRRHVSWFISDAIVALLAVVTASLLWRSQERLGWGTEHFAGLAILLAIVFGGINAAFGLNRIVWSDAYAEDGAWLALSAGSVTILTCVLNYLQSRFHWLPYAPLPDSMIFTIGLMASIGFVVTRYRFRLLTGLATRWIYWRHGASRVVERVLIVGSGEGYQVANWLLKQGVGSRLLSIIGVVDDEHPTMHGMRVKGNPILGGISDLEALIRKYDVGVVLSANADLTAEQAAEIGTICKANNARLILVSELLDVLRGQLTQPARRPSLVAAQESE
jgi:lipopolysaccharide/colanic/teichoic acid biosynthesis glycosyltransferase